MHGRAGVLPSHYLEQLPQKFWASLKKSGPNWSQYDKSKFDIIISKVQKVALVKL